MGPTLKTLLLRWEMQVHKSVLNQAVYCQWKILQNKCPSASLFSELFYPIHVLNQGETLSWQTGNEKHFEMCLQLSALFTLMTFPPSYWASLVPAAKVKCFANFTKQRDARKEAEGDWAVWSNMFEGYRPLWCNPCFNGLDTWTFFAPSRYKSSSDLCWISTSAWKLYLDEKLSHPLKIVKIDNMPLKGSNILVFLAGETREQNVSSKY